MKQVVGIDCGNYIFSPSTSKITFVGLPELQLENIVLITDVTTGTIIYNFATANTGTLTNNVLTLDYNTTALSSTDRLMIIINTPSDSDNANIVKITHDTPGQQSKNVGIPVALVNEHILDMQTPIDARTNPLINTIIGGVIDCLQYRSIAIQIQTGAGISAGVLTFEGSNQVDNAYNTWVVVSLYDQVNISTLPASTVTLAASTDRFLAGPLQFRYFRIRVSTTVAGGSVAVSSVFRMTPFSPAVNQVAQSTGNWSSNMAQLGGQNLVTAGLNGTLAVGGNIAPGSSPTVNPLTIGGVDVNGLVRRIVTDLQGQLVVVGPDQSKIIGSQPVNATLGNKRFGTDELLEMILQELKLQSYYLKEMPYQLNIGQNFRDTIDDFTQDNIDRATNG